MNIPRVMSNDTIKLATEAFSYTRQKSSRTAVGKLIVGKEVVATIWELYALGGICRTKVYKNRGILYLIT